MSDARWFEVEEDVAAAVEHLGKAAALFRRGGFEGDDLPQYQARMAFMHAMQAGHTSMESAFVRILRMLGEEPPQGRDWHADLIRRVARPLPGRPTIIGPELADAADETRRFRHVAMRAYGRFDPGRAQAPARAAATLAAQLPGAVARFRAAVDPPSGDAGAPEAGAPGSP